MAIKSELVLPYKFIGSNWEAELLDKVGSRNGMKCIYKIRMHGDTKRAGIYVKTTDMKQIVFDIAGNEFVYDLTTNTITYRALNSFKYNGLPTEGTFLEVIRLTAAHFGYISAEGVYKAAMPRVIELTDAEVAEIPAFGVF